MKKVDKYLAPLMKEYPEEYASKSYVWEEGAGDDWEDKYTIGGHTKRVLGQFNKYRTFNGEPLPKSIDKDLFRNVLALHDIGVHRAVTENAKNRNEFVSAKREHQHEYTSGYLHDVLKKRGFGDKDILVAESIVSGDPLGSYLKGESSVSDTAKKIRASASKVGMPTKDFFSALNAYYMSDASSYTKDGGGIESLDYLFNPNGKDLAYSGYISKQIDRLKGALLVGKEKEGTWAKERLLATEDDMGVIVRDAKGVAEGVDASLAGILSNTNKLGYKSIASDSGLLRDYPHPEKRSQSTGYISYLKVDNDSRKIDDIKDAAKKVGLSIEENDIYFHPAVSVRMPYTKDLTGFSDLVKEANVLATEKVGGDIYGKDWKEWLREREKFEEKLVEEHGGLLQDDKKVISMWRAFSKELVKKGRGKKGEWATIYDRYYSPEALEAIQGTEDASLTDKGLKLNVVRYQPPDIAGEEAIRTGVFFLPEKKSPYQKYYTTGRIGYGGKMRTEGMTTYRHPIVIKGASGGKVPERAYDLLKGKGAYRIMRSNILSTTGLFSPYSKDTVEEKRHKLKAVIAKYGGNPDMADYIVGASNPKYNQLAYALQEHIVAHAVREAGYDSVIGYNKVGGKTRLSEVFDVRQSYYPDTEKWERHYEDYYKGKKAPEKLKGTWAVKYAPMPLQRTARPHKKVKGNSTRVGRVR